MVVPFMKLQNMAISWWEPAFIFQPHKHFRMHPGLAFAEPIVSITCLWLFRKGNDVIKLVQVYIQGVLLNPVRITFHVRNQVARYDQNHV